MLKERKEFKISIFEIFCVSLIEIIISIAGCIIFSISEKNNTNIELLLYMIFVFAVWSIAFSMINFHYGIVEIIKGKRKYNKNFVEIIKQQKYTVDKYAVQLMIINSGLTIISIILMMIYLFI